METLNKIASLELSQSRRRFASGGIDLVETLDDLRIVLEPYCQEADIEVHWDIPAVAAAGLGRPPPPAAGAAEPDEEQRARAGRRGR